MRSLLATGSEAMDAATGRSLSLSAFLPSMQRLSSLSGRSSDGGESTAGSTAMRRRAVPSGGLTLGLGTSVAPSTHHLDRILNEPDDEDEEDEEDEAEAEEDARGDVRGARGALVDLMHSHLMGYRHADRAFNPYLWMGPGAFGGSPVDTSSGSASPRASQREEIDLTVSSDSEGDGEGGWLTATRPPSTALTDGEEAQDDEVQIVGSTGEPLRRKRRRPAASTAGSTGEGMATKRARGDGFDPNAAESTRVSMDNMDAVERFKQALKCSICLDVMTDMTSTRCGHVYCARCISTQVRINAKCPLCQRRLQLKDIHPLFF